MKDAVVAYICIVVGFMVLVLVGTSMYEHNEQRKSLEFACMTLGGVYVDTHTCIKGENLFYGAD